MSVYTIMQMALAATMFGIWLWSFPAASFMFCLLMAFGSAIDDAAEKAGKP